jgi:fatty acid desaturase
MLVARYTTTRGDVLRFYGYHYSRSPGFVVFQIVILAMLATSSYRALPADAPAMTRVVVFAMLFLAAVAFLFLLFFGSTAVQILMTKDKTLFVEHTVTLREDGFTEQTTFNTTEHTWAAVQRLRRSRRHIFIYIGAHLAHIVPRRAFAADAEWDAFYAFCRERTQTA